MSPNPEIAALNPVPVLIVAPPNTRCVNAMVHYPDPEKYEVLFDKIYSPFSQNSTRDPSYVIDFEFPINK